MRKKAESLPDKQEKTGRFKRGEHANPYGRPPLSRASAQVLRDFVDKQFGGKEGLLEAWFGDIESNNYPDRWLPLVRRIFPEVRSITYCEPIDMANLSIAEQIERLLALANNSVISLDQALLTISGLEKKQAIESGQNGPSKIEFIVTNSPFLQTAEEASVEIIEAVDAP